MGGHDFNGVFSWFTLLVLIALHISAILNGGKSAILMSIFYFMLTVWMFGFIII